MEALLVETIPAGKEWQYEPKWDGFRCLAFKDGKNVELQSKSGQSLGRYFPELISALQQIKAKKFVLDGEIVIPMSQVTESVQAVEAETLEMASRSTGKR
jgi:ATP-dependent DNA ligase